MKWIHHFGHLYFTRSFVVSLVHCFVLATLCIRRKCGHRMKRIRKRFVRTRTHTHTHTNAGGGDRKSDKTSTAKGRIIVQPCVADNINNI
jgi:hypothetical protein